MSLQKLRRLGLLLLLLITSLACSLPYGIGLDRSAGPIPDFETPVADVGSQLEPTRTPTFTPLPTFAPTDTPVPTPTSTRVVPPTDTPDPNAPTPTQVYLGLGPSPTPVIEEVAVSQEDGQPVESTPQAIQQVIALPVAGSQGVLVNGDFEAEWPAGRGVAPGWHPFDSGQAYFGWHREGWNDVIFTGHQSQLIAVINDQGVGDQFAGIYQTVHVVPGAEYELTIRGLIRSDEGSNDESGYGYLMQYGIDFSGSDRWEAVGDWITLPFPEYPREDPTGINEYPFATYKARFRPPGPQLTIFIRGVKKWPDFQEGNFDVDAVSLQGTGTRQTVVRTIIPTPSAPVTQTGLLTTTQQGDQAPVLPVTGGFSP